MTVAVFTNTQTIIIIIVGTFILSLPFLAIFLGQMQEINLYRKMADKYAPNVFDETLGKWVPRRSSTGNETK